MMGVLRKAMHPRVLRFGPGAAAWRLAVAIHGLPDHTRYRLARRLAQGLQRAGRPAAAVHTLLTAADQTADLRERADLLVTAGLLDLRRGVVPPRLADAIRAEAARADLALREGHRRTAAESMALALRLAFNRVLHIDRTASPMSDDPQAFLEPLHASRAFAEMTAAAGRLRDVGAPAEGRPMRLLFATHRNDHFLAEIRDRYARHPGVEVRSLDLARDPALEHLVRSRARIVAARFGADREFRRRAEAHLRQHLDWADTVFIDWCTGPAVLFTAIDPGTTRIVLRLHSFEVFSQWPFLTDFSRIDDVVFVSAHLRDLAVAAVPALRRPHAPALHVIHNAMDLERYQRPKDDAARFTIGMVGISSVAKDARWALEVLRTIRAEDERYRLVLIGADVDGSLSPAARDYARAYEREVEELESTGAVHRLGQVSDVPEALRSVGVILSASVRESFHCGLVEGAASGAVPVVRDWPFFAGKPNGAHTLFPAQWLVHSPRQAADRILSATAREEDWRSAGQAAAAHARAAWGWPIVAAQFDDLLRIAPAGAQ